MFNHDSYCSNAARDSRGQSSYDSKTNERASLRRSRFQGRTLTSTWGKSKGWLKGVNFQRRLIHVLAPLTSFHPLFRWPLFPIPTFLLSKNYILFHWIFPSPTCYYFHSFLMMKTKEVTSYRKYSTPRNLWTFRSLFFGENSAVL